MQDARVVGRSVPSCGDGLTRHTHQRQQRSCSRLAPRASASLRDDAAGSDAAGPGEGWSRRAVLGGLGAASAALGLSGGLQAASPGPASAYIVDEENALRVFGMASPSVVGIIDSKRERNGDETPEGVGSGVVWTKQGHILTNYHCIAKLAKDTSGTQITRVELIDEHGLATQFNARLVASEPASDLAVLQIDAPPEMLSPVTLASSGALRVGQLTYAIGNPFGLSKTLTSGVVSGLNRAIPSPTGQRIPGVIQTDAAISAGNSGGPLLDSGGRVIGLNTATFTRKDTGRSSGVNFAIPSDALLDKVPNLILYGNSTGKGLGGPRSA